MICIWACLDSFENNQYKVYFQTELNLIWTELEREDATFCLFCVGYEAMSKWSVHSQRPQYKRLVNIEHDQSYAKKDFQFFKNPILTLRGRRYKFWLDISLKAGIICVRLIDQTVFYL